MANKKANGNGAGEPQATALPLFYQKPEPLDAKRHAALALRKNFGFGFASKVNAVPVNLIEMPQICHFYPIAFSPDENATPVALIGVRDHENLFVDSESGQWLEDAYVPAYIRRYPFIFSELPNSDQMTLCVDAVPEIVENGGEQKFFAEDGQPTDLSKNALEFCKSYHAAAMQTIEFGKALAASDLLVERAAEIRLPDQGRINFSGFRIVDEQKLNALDDATFMEWRKKGWLPFIYAHLFSGAQWQRLTRLLNARTQKKTA